MLHKLHVINDETRDRDLVHPDGRDIHDPAGRGLELPPDGFRDYSGLARPFPASLLIPRSEWQARIQEREQRKARLRDKIRASEMKVKNQGRTNYCWINSPTWAAQIVRMLQGQKHVELSPASAGAQIKNGWNSGGWGREGLQWIVDKGLVPSSLWPDNEINLRLATPVAKAEALKYRVDEWWVLDNRDHDQVVSCLLRDIPVCSGLNWWSHEITYTDPVWLDGEACIEFGNSWGESYGDGGYGVLQGRRMLSDDAVAPCTAIAA